MKARSIYLYSGNDDFYSATIGHGPLDSPDSKDRSYHPTRASAWRLAKAMERILDSKKFWCTIVSPRSLTILLRCPEERAP